VKRRKEQGGVEWIGGGTDSAEGEGVEEGAYGLEGWGGGGRAQKDGRSRRGGGGGGCEM